jgi:hypothetical protein
LLGGAGGGSPSAGMLADVRCDWRSDFLGRPSGVDGRVELGDETWLEGAGNEPVEKRRPKNLDVDVGATAGEAGLGLVFDRGGGGIDTLVFFA